MLRRIVVGDMERALVTRDKRFEKLLGPGSYWVPTLGSLVEVERHTATEVEFSSRWAAHLAAGRPDLISRWFLLVETRDSEVAVVFLDGKVHRVVGPGKRLLFWRSPFTVRADVMDALANPEVPAGLVPSLARLGPGALAAFTLVDEGKRGLLSINGRLVRELAPGSYAFWSAVVAPRVELVELRLQTLDVPGQEILTRDKVSVRVNVSAVFEILDPARARASVKDATDHLYRTLQIAVRRTLGKRLLDEILAEKADIDSAVAAECSGG